MKRFWANFNRIPDIGMPKHMKKELIIISGFLGSGKTTFLLKALPSLAGKKVALLLNDFGRMPVDGAILRGEGIDGGIIAEIGGGSVFCACLKESFIRELRRFGERDEEIVILEASGMSDPALIDRMLALSGLDQAYDHKTTICVFDPVKSLKLAKVLEVVPRQLASATVALLSKCDVYGEAEIAAAENYIAEKEKDLPVLRLSSKFDLASLPGRPVKSFVFGFNTPENRPDGISLDHVDYPVDDFIRLIRNNKDILRVKGFLKAKDGCWFLSDTGREIKKRKEEACAAPLSIICAQGAGESLRKTIECGLASAK